MAELEEVTAALRDRGISVCIDFVLNHTAKEHDWAIKARAGESRYQKYYWTFPDRTLPDRYEQTLVEVFPAHAPRELHLVRRHAALGLDHLQRTPWT